MTSVRGMFSNTTRRILAMSITTMIAGAAGCATSTPQRVYIGTYTKGWACDQNDCTSKGIYRADFDPASGKLSGLAVAAESENPSYLTVHPNGKFLYAVNELGDWKGDKTGAVSAFAIEPSGDLRLLNQLSSFGADPCHISLTSSGKEVLVANYSGGSVASYTIGEDGQLQEGSNVKHSGKSVHKNQEAPHAHYITESPQKAGMIYVADLGI
ncbi:MAG TPA: beta-propeller fold lactonase family protein, partial [Polyangia bacterium]